MTKAAANATSIKTPETEGEYRIYVVDASGKILSKSRHLLRLSGSSAGIEAESFDYQSGIDLENCSEGGSDVAYIENGDYIGFKGIDLTGGESIDFRIGSNGAAAALEVRIDSPDGTRIGKMDVKGTGGWQKWETQNCPIEATSGVHDLYFVFTGDEGYLYNLNWWKLNAVEVPPVLGDLNGDDMVDIFDLALLKKAVLTGETDYFRNADVDGDGELTTLDVVAHTKYLHKLILVFPASE